MSFRGCQFQVTCRCSTISCPYSSTSMIGSHQQKSESKCLSPIGSSDRDYGGIEPCRIYEHQRRSPPHRGSKYQADREESLLPSVMPFKAIAGERTTCSAAIRANRIVLIRSTAAESVTSPFTGFIAFNHYRGKACAKALVTQNRFNKWRQSRKFSPEEALVMAAVTKGRVPTGRHPPK